MGEIPYPEHVSPMSLPLDDETAQIALRELHEEPQQREGAIETLRAWIKQQPHLSCRTDRNYLLAYLRGAKFSQLKARDMISGSLSIFTDLSNWFRNIDPIDPQIIKVVETGHTLLLPPDDEGHRIIMQRAAAIDPDTKEFSIDDQIKASIAISSYCYFDPSVQVRGVVFLFDLTGQTIKHGTRFGYDNIRKLAKAMQGHFPGRFKAFHFYNVGPVMESLLTFMRPLLSKKFNERIHLHGSNLEHLYKDIPMRCLPDEYLPDDYTGPSAGSIPQLIEQLKVDMAKPEFRDWIRYDTQAKWRVDESKRPQEDEVASFRKLNLD